MHPFVTQTFARQHQELLMNEAEQERLTRQQEKHSKFLSRQPVVQASKSMSEPDFAAIRCDLRSTLTEWYMEPRTEDFEEMIDTFMRRLKRRLGHREQRRETGILL
jgi:phosphotransacetylase